MLFETLSRSLDEVQSHIDENKVELFEDFRICWDHISYGSKAEKHFEIKSLKGKKTRKWLHINIYRLDCGKYEVNCYCL